MLIFLDKLMLDVKYVYSYYVYGNLFNRRLFSQNHIPIMFVFIIVISEPFIKIRVAPKPKYLTLARNLSNFFTLYTELLKSINQLIITSSQLDIKWNEYEICFRCVSSIKQEKMLLKSWLSC